MTESEIRTYTQKITDSLKTLDPETIILFGSAAKNNTKEDSDFDILIVLNNDTIPDTYEDKLQLKLMVRDSLGQLSKQIPIDLIVYTKPEYFELQKLNNSFYREIKSTGKVLYDKAS
ncbi:nucleotidyltransferase domain-containing protein [Candidatus Woesearchaeota archaeon]|nr:nucleotidyltransferase domain-containing protein [Candidatus Woesearchaeota archaeon]